MARITKKELVEVVSRKAHLTKRGAEEAIEVFLNEIGRSLSKGDEVLLSGFGTFEPKWMDSKSVKIPKTETVVNIKRHRAPKFRAGKKLKRQISG
jgi:DNA-binding protein HU-beta